MTMTPCKSLAHHAQLETELHTHLASIARWTGDGPCGGIPPSYAYDDDDDDDLEADDDVEHDDDALDAAIASSWGRSSLSADPQWTTSHLYGRGYHRRPEDATWYPHEPRWITADMSWAQRHLVDVYAVYAALVMAVGLLMKLTWSLVW